MSSSSELWIQAQDKKTGKTWIVSLDWLADNLKQRLGICQLKENHEWDKSRLDAHIEKIIALEHQLAMMLLPQARVTLVMKLKEGALDTRQVNKFIEAQSPLIFCRAVRMAWEQLVAEKTVDFQRQPEGRARMWFLIDDPLALVKAQEEV